MKQYINKLENLHIGISGTCLAFITLSNSWMIKDIVYLKPIAITIAIIMLSLILMRLIKFPKVMLNELKDPVLGTFYPTFGMVTWLVWHIFINIFHVYAVLYGYYVLFTITQF